MLKRISTLLGAGLILIAGSAVSQTSDSFAARLGWVPVSLSELRLVGGQGSVTASLARSRLTISGTFDGLPSPAASARLHLGAAPGARGPAIADLDVSTATSGSIGGEVELDRRQREALLAGQLYIQIYADSGVPPDDGMLRGWLFAQPDGSAGRR